MPRRDVAQIIEGEWMPWKRKERWICCDCSLMHRVEYRVNGEHLEVRFFRENRSTGAYRRHQGLKLVTKK